MDLAKIMKFANDSRHNGTDPESMPVPYVFFISLSTLFGTAGNILIIGTVLSNKKLKTECNIFIVNLAIADLCVTGFVNPFSFIGVFLGDNWFAEKLVLCETIASVCLTSCYCSLQSIGAISFNRYIHICHNKLYTRLFTPVKTVLMVLALWVVSFLMEMPSFLGWGGHVYDIKTRSCIWDRTADFSYTLFFATAGVVFPVALISGSYLKIYLYVRRSRKQVSHHYHTTATTTNNASTHQSQTDTKELRVSTRLTVTLFVIFLVFVTCWMPYAVVITADIHDTFPDEIHLYVLLLAHMNSGLNWLVYGATNREFRKGYFRFLRLNRFTCMNKWLFHTTETTTNKNTTAYQHSGMFTMESSVSYRMANPMADTLVAAKKAKKHLTLPIIENGTHA